LKQEQREGSKKTALTTKWLCEQVHCAVAQGSYPDRWGI
jgi:hypothetical protein